MITIHAESISTIENYKLLTGSVVPRPIAMVTSLSENGVLNIAPFSYFNIVASDPPILSVSIARKQGQMKDTTRNIMSSKELVIHIVHEEMTEQMNHTAANLPHDQSELDLTDLHTVPSEKVAVPGIRESLVRYECQLDQHVAITNDEGIIVQDLLLVRVLCYHFDEKVIDHEHMYILTEQLKPVARLAGNNYAGLAQQFSFDRPS